MKRNPFKLRKKPGHESSLLFAIWSEEPGGFEAKIFEFLNRHMKGEEFCILDPSDFFPLEGVQVRDDIASIPESKFYQCEKDLVLFFSEPPQNEWYRYLNAVLDVAETCCKVKEVYTIGRIISVCAHTTPREFFGVFSSRDYEAELKPYNLNKKIDYINPPDQRPTIGSYFIWTAKKRNIKAASLWVTVPFYLARTGDPRAHKKVLEFLDRRFGLGIDFSEIKAVCKAQAVKISELRSRSPRIDELIGRLETNLMLSEEESVRLVNEIEEYLGT